MPHRFQSIDQLFPNITEDSGEDRRRVIPLIPSRNYTSSSLERFKPPNKHFSVIRSKINESMIERSETNESKGFNNDLIKEYSS